jgi:hypothetical protein
MAMMLPHSGRLLVMHASKHSIKQCYPAIAASHARAALVTSVHKQAQEEVLADTFAGINPLNIYSSYQ